jgi:chromatin remodeling complex protein RSC6
MVRTNNKSSTATPTSAPVVVPTPAPVTSDVAVDGSAPEIKDKKSKKKENNAEPVAASTESAPVKAKAPRAKKAAAPVADAPAADSAAPSTDATETASTGSQLQTMVNEQGQLIQKLLTEIVVLKNNHKMIEKQQARELKNAQKAQSKSKGKGAKKEKSDKPSSFELPTEISGEIARFVGVNEGTKLSRTEVNKKIHDYVVANSLSDAKDRRTIIPDEKLRVLLRVPAGAKLGYFNLQTYLSGHFATRQRAPLYK